MTRPAIPLQSLGDRPTKRSRLYIMLLMAMILLPFAMKPTNAAGQLTVTVSTDKQSYEAGQLITITGQVLDTSLQGVALASVSIQVNDPNGKPIHLASIISSMDGSFTDQFTIPADSFNGSYTVFATASKTGYTDASTQIVLAVVPEFSTSYMAWLIILPIFLAILVARKRKTTT